MSELRVPLPALVPPLLYSSCSVSSPTVLTKSSVSLFLGKSPVLSNDPGTCRFSPPRRARSRGPGTSSVTSLLSLSLLPTLWDGGTPFRRDSGHRHGFPSRAVFGPPVLFESGVGGVRVPSLTLYRRRVFGGTS